jgi:hypothetical protein
MLHKKRTGKGLHITKEIVESEAMYEEVDERYHEKRMRYLKDQTDQIEAQFQRQLLAAFTLGANSTRPSTRVSADGGIQKMRIDIASTRPYQPRHQHHRQSSGAGVLPSPTASSPGLETSGASSMQEGTYASSPGSSYVQTPGAYSHMIPPQQMPGYFTPEMSPTWSSQSAAPPPQELPLPQAPFVAWRQPVLQRPSAVSQQAPWVGHPSRQRLASTPDALMLLNSGLPSMTRDDVHRAQSEPAEAQPAPQSDPGPIFVNFNDEPWATPELSASSISSNASEMSSADDLEPKQPIMVSTEELDADYDEFTRYALGLESQPQWQTPLADSGFEDWFTLDNGDNTDLTMVA